MIATAKTRVPANLLARAICAVVGSLAMLALAACGSANSGAQSGSSQAAATAQAGSKAQAEVTRAQAVASKYLNQPTKIPLSQPLKSAPAKGKTFVWVQCDFSQCTELGDAAAQAAAAVGWKMKVVPYKAAQPATLLAAMTQALQYHPAAVGVASNPESEWASEIPAYKAAGVPIIALAVGSTTELNSTVIASINGPADSQMDADALGNWFIANSAAAGNAVLLNVPSIPSLNDFSQDFQEVVKSGCTACKIQDLDATIPEEDAGQLNQLVVSALQRNPSIRYVVSADGAFIEGLQSSLAAAGLSKVRVLANWGTVATEADLKTGPFVALTGQNIEYEGALLIDVALRHSEGMPITTPNDGGLPFQILTKTTLVAPAVSYNYPSDSLQQLEKLWKVG